MQPSYTIHPCGNLQIASINDPNWSSAECVLLNHYRPESSSHHPRVEARLLWSPEGIHGLFKVNDQYVRAAHTEFQSDVWKDSCVEWFVQPKAGMGYFNFEMNCGGSLLCSYVTDPTRVPTGLKQASSLPGALGKLIQIQSSLPKRVDPEITDPSAWSLAFYIPLTVFEPYIGKIPTLSGQSWRGNFYKCAEEVSHPHWGAWSPVDALNFHLPHCFGELRFADS